MVDLNVLGDLIDAALSEGVVECPNCGTRLESDTYRCPCGWKNPLVMAGYL